MDHCKQCDGSAKSEVGGDRFPCAACLGTGNEDVRQLRIRHLHSMHDSERLRARTVGLEGALRIVQAVLDGEQHSDWSAGEPALRIQAALDSAATTAGKG